MFLCFVPMFQAVSVNGRLSFAFVGFVSQEILTYISHFFDVRNIGTLSSEDTIAFLLIFTVSDMAG